MIDISSLVDILGAGGGGGKGGGAGSYNEAPNTLRTISTLYLLFLLSNGEIKGFPPGQDIRKFIYINEIPIISPDGTVNYKGVAADFRSGTAIQDAITGASGFTTGNTISVQARIFKGNGPIIRFINAPGADAIRVSLYTPSLLTIKDDGSAGARVDFRIELSVNGGPWVTKVQSYIDGKTSGGFSRDYTIRVIGNGPWQVRVTRLTADSLTDRLSNQLYWQSVSPLFTDRLIYPNRAILFLGV
jgi:predicted phage tail protein